MRSQQKTKKVTKCNLLNRLQNSFWVASFLINSKCLKTLEFLISRTKFMKRTKKLESNLNIEFKRIVYHNFYEQREIMKPRVKGHAHKGRKEISQSDLVILSLKKNLNIKTGQKLLRRAFDINSSWPPTTVLISGEQKF